MTTLTPEQALEIARSTFMSQCDGIPSPDSNGEIIRFAAAIKQLVRADAERESQARINKLGLTIATLDNIDCDKDKRIAAQQAKIDSLMLEYCQDEMTEQQLFNWSKHQRAVRIDELASGIPASQSQQIDLNPVIKWLENGCDPKEAAKELRIYQSKIVAASKQGGEG